MYNLSFEGIGYEDTQGDTSFERGVGRVSRLKRDFSAGPMSV